MGRNKCSTEIIFLFENCLRLDYGDYELKCEGYTQTKINAPLMHDSARGAEYLVLFFLDTRNFIPVFSCDSSGLNM